MWVCLASWLAGCTTPIVTTEHGAFNRRRTWLFRWMDRPMYRRFTAIAAISDVSRNSLLAHLGSMLQKVHVVLNGVDANRFEFHPQQSREPKTAKLVILSTGSLIRLKDQATAIRAIARIDGAKLMLAGDGPLRNELETLASRLGVRSRVEFLGVRKDIPQLIASADLYVQTSLREGFCLAVVEAMCGGLPCIVSRNEGLSEIVGPAGVYFEPGNVDELASAIRLLSGDPRRRAELAQRGVDRASRYTLAACYARYEDFYRTVIQRASRGGK
jgi:glycosyltransferase involved in cell wall biosynthesis